MHGLADSEAGCVLASRRQNLGGEDVRNVGILWTCQVPQCCGSPLDRDAAKGSHLLRRVRGCKLVGGQPGHCVYPTLRIDHGWQGLGARDTKKQRPGRRRGALQNFGGAEFPH